MKSLGLDQWRLHTHEAREACFSSKLYSGRKLSFILCCLTKSEMLDDEYLTGQHGKNQLFEGTAGLLRHVSGAGGFSKAPLTKPRPILQSLIAASHVPSINKHLTPLPFSSFSSSFSCVLALSCTDLALSCWSSSSSSIHNIACSTQRPMSSYHFAAWSWHQDIISSAHKWPSFHGMVIS